MIQEQSEVESAPSRTYGNRYSSGQVGASGVRRWIDRQGFWASPLLRLILVLIVTALVAYPLVELIRAPIGDFIDLWSEAKGIPKIAQTLLNTLVLGLASMVFGTLIAMSLAWCRAYLPGSWGTAAGMIAILPMLIPPISGVVGWSFLLSPRVGYVNAFLRQTPFWDHLDTGPFNIFTLPWIIIITGIYLVPYAFIFIQAGVRNVDSRLEDAARISGSSWLSTQLRIVMPLIRPSLIFGGGIVLLLALGQFTAPLLLGRSVGIDVITTEMFRQASLPPPNYSMAAFLALPVMILSFVGIGVQRRALRDEHRFVVRVKGTGSGRRGSRWAAIPVVIYGALAVLPPLSGLVVVSLSPFWSGTIEPETFSFQAFERLFSNPVTFGAIKNSISFALIATVLCLALAVASGYILLRSKGRLRQVMDYLVNMPVAVPAILFGMGIFLAYAVGPATIWLRQSTGINLYGSRALIIAAYVVLLLPHGVRLVQSGLAQIGTDLETAARVSGSTFIGALFRITVPLLRRNLVGAAVVMFVIMSHEFAASVLLSGPGTQVMSTVLYDRWETGTYPFVAAMALVMVIVALLGVTLISAFDSRSSRRE